MMKKLKKLFLTVKAKLEKFFTFGFEDEIFYVNGSESLPPPLTKEKEEEILCEIEQKNYEHRELLVVHNLRLVVYIARKFENTGIGIEDLVSIGSIGLIKAVNTFCPS
ncbi:MAG: sigma factor, partial [Oscillospiraceae bacterium]|nr:sigma factor [Oscillospiraceae bacterium]